MPAAVGLQRADPQNQATCAFSPTQPFCFFQTDTDDRSRDHTVTSHGPCQKCFLDTGSGGKLTITLGLRPQDRCWCCCSFVTRQTTRLTTKRGLLLMLMRSRWGWGWGRKDSRTVRKKIGFRVRHRLRAGGEITASQPHGSQCANHLPGNTAASLHDFWRYGNGHIRFVN